MITSNKDLTICFCCLNNFTGMVESVLDIRMDLRGRLGDTEYNSKGPAGVESILAGPVN
jgi:hypothetical protein